MALTVVLIALVVIFLLWNASKKPHKYPPGKWPLFSQMMICSGGSFAAH
jgi:hypothetical protein